VVVEGLGPGAGPRVFGRVGVGEVPGLEIQTAETGMVELDKLEVLPGPEPGEEALFEPLLRHSPVALGTDRDLVEDRLSHGGGLAGGGIKRGDAAAAGVVDEVEASAAAVMGVEFVRFQPLPVDSEEEPAGR